MKRINNALRRADQIEWSEGSTEIDWFVPIVADGEAGFGGPLNVFELTKSFIEAGAAGVHFEDQLASEKKCGHMGGKVLVPTGQHIRTLQAARLAADVLDVPTRPGGPDRRQLGDSDHLGHRRAGPSIPHRGADRRRASSGSGTDWSRRSPAVWPTRRIPT